MTNIYMVCDWALRPPDLGIEAMIHMPYTWVRKAWTPPRFGRLRGLRDEYGRHGLPLDLGDSEALCMGS